MHLKKLHLNNYRCYDDVEVFFDEKLTVLVGANGTGKTTILDGVATALSTLFVKMGELTSISIDKRQAHLKSFGAGSTVDVQAQFPVVVSACMEAFGLDYEWSRVLNGVNSKTTVSDAKNVIQLGVDIQKRVRRGDTSQILPLIAYYGTGRLWDYHREKQGNVFEANNRLHGYLNCLDGTANIKLMLNWFLKMTVTKYQNQELNRGSIPELEAVLSAMEECFKRISQNEDSKIRYSLATKELEITYRDTDGKWMCMPFSHLSDGYRSTVSLVADIAYRMAVLNPQLLDRVCSETDGIVLIDEVDLHLHPKWQQRILGDLAAIFPKVQFIVSTHAPAVINTAKSENVVILDQYQVFSPSDQVHGRDINSIVSSLMQGSERPVEIKEQFGRFYECIDCHDLTAAEEVLEELKGIIGENDSEISSCDVKLALLKERFLA